MSGKFSILFTIANVVFLFNKVECVEKVKTGESLECWPYVNQIDYVDFRIDLYFSFERTVQQLLRPRRFLSESFGFDPKRKTTVIVHGLQGHANDSLLIELRNELILLQDRNILLMDWNAGAYSAAVYPVTVVNTRTAAEYLTQVFSDTLSYWWSHKNIRTKDWGPIHFIGHSLGAHVVGQAARYLKARKNLTISRITALDPAEPCFENSSFPLRLKKSDAKFVDVIHTDSMPKRNSGFGIYEPMGHADFYVNGGSRQPGCADPLNYEEYTTSRRKRELDYLQILVHSIFEPGVCAHTRALQLFVESVQQNRLDECKFWARKWTPGTNIPQNTPCNATICQQFGINARRPSNNRSVSYYVATTGARPFCNVSQSDQLST